MITKVYFGDLCGCGLLNSCLPKNIKYSIIKNKR